MLRARSAMQEKKIKVKLQIVGAHLYLTKWNYTVVLIFIQENAACGATFEKKSSQIDLAVFFSANSAEAGISLVVPCNLRRFVQKNS